jgi:hypothetical protein
LDFGTCRAAGRRPYAGSGNSGYAEGFFQSELAQGINSGLLVRLLN